MQEKVRMPEEEGAKGKENKKTGLKKEDAQNQAKWKDGVQAILSGLNLAISTK